MVGSLLTLDGRRVIKVNRFGPPEVMQLLREPLPEPSAGHVLVAVDAAGVNFADTMVRRGEYRRDQTLPCTPGIEVAGRVLSGDAGPAPGARVVALLEDGGGYADHVLAPANRVYPIPDEIDSTQAAAVFLQGVTAWYALHRFGEVQQGEWVLVHAAGGGVGGLAVQLGLVAGARVIAAASNEEKLRPAREHGAQATLVADPPALAGEVRELTSGRGCDVVIDGVGGDLFAPSLAALAKGGRYVVVGAASQQPATLDVRRLLPRTQRVAGFIVAGVLARSPEEPHRALERIFELLRRGELRLAVTEFPLERAAEAHRLIEARVHTGKLILTTT